MSEDAHDSNNNQIREESVSFASQPPQSQPEPVTDPQVTAAYGSYAYWKQMCEALKFEKNRLLEEVARLTIEHEQQRLTLRNQSEMLKSAERVSNNLSERQKVQTNLLDNAVAACEAWHARYHDLRRCHINTLIELETEKSRALDLQKALTAMIRRELLTEPKAVATFLGNLHEFRARVNKERQAERLKAHTNAQATFHDQVAKAEQTDEK